ncbi:hypothetical protein ACHAXR_000363 [Thalassiosira sp. AJA248-18]
MMDPGEPHVIEEMFNNNADWTGFYGDIQEQQPPRMPEPLGKPVLTTAFVDSDHASNVVTQRSHTGIMIFINNALIRVFSKRQNTVESSAFGSELVALRICRDSKLMSIGVPLKGPTNVHCDNLGVVKNTSIHESHDQKKAEADGILRVGKEDTVTNITCLYLPVIRK